MSFKFKRAVLGGTFDHLHQGHKFFIGQALGVSMHLTIGLVRKNLIENKILSGTIEDYETRENIIKSWLSERESLSKVKIISIDDVFGTTLTDRDIDAIFATKHGQANARLINKKRQEKKLPPLKINLVPFLRGEDGKIISSTRIRMGEINRLGYPYARACVHKLILPKALREEIKHIPGGLLLETPGDLSEFIKGGSMVIAVGDVIAKILKDLGKQADISIIDFKTRRGRFDEGDLNPDASVRNDQGSINPQAVGILKNIIKENLKTGGKKVIKILGEEDLLALPSVLLAPLEARIIYGMPKKGAIGVKVTEEKKEEVLVALKKFTRAV